MRWCILLQLFLLRFNDLLHKRFATLTDLFKGFTSFRRLTLSVSGYYYNVNVEGASTAIGSLAYLNAEAFPAATNNTKVKVKGYYVGVSSDMYVNTMTVSVEAVN